MEKSTQIEPGILFMFRAIVCLQTVWFAIDAIANIIHAALGYPFEIYPFEHSHSFIYVNLGLILLLDGYLWFRPLQVRLGALFLPLGLTIAASFALAGEHYGFFTIYRFSRLDLGMEIESGRLLITLLFPLIATAWQYRYRYAVLYCGLTGVADLLPKIYMVGTESPYVHPLVEVLVIRTLLYLFVAFIISCLIAEQRKQRQALARANRELVQYAGTLEKLTISRERNRLAHELHDTLAHTLSSMAVELEAIKTVLESKDAQQSGQAERLLDRTLEAAREGLRETRRALKALKSGALEDLGLTDALKSLAQRSAEANDLVLDWQVAQAIEDLSPDVEQTIYRTAQEAIENTIRHAQANTLRIKLEQTERGILLEVGDDGKGFKAAAVDPQAHFGIQGMRERARIIGARFTLESQPDEGTTVRLFVERKGDKNRNL